MLENNSTKVSGFVVYLFGPERLQKSGPEFENICVNRERPLEPQRDEYGSLSMLDSAMIEQQGWCKCD
jgi:hypothetical protein